MSAFQHNNVMCWILKVMEMLCSMEALLRILDYYRYYVSDYKIRLNTYVT